MSDYVLRNAWALHQAGNLNEAARLYNEVLRANPRHPGALQMLGFLHFQRGEFDLAERVMHKAVKLDPRSVDAQYNHGCALQSLNRHRDALSALDRALGLQPDHGPARLNRANSLSQLGRFEDALKDYDRALGLMPATAEALMNRANALFELGRHTDALAGYEAALAKDPRHALLWNNRGNALRALGRHEDSHASFERAAVLDPAYADAFANRGQARVSLARDSEALADFERALALDPRHVEALHNRARLLKKQGRMTEALEACDTILQLEPAHAEALIERGVLLIALKRPDEALAAFDRALALAPASVDGLSNRASALIRLKRYDEALADAERALAIDATYSAAWHNRASALDRLKRHQEALGSYDRALALAPENATSWNNRGSALLSLKQEAAALSHFDRALSLNPSDPDIWSNRAQAFSALKRLTEAIEASDQALTRESDHPAATRIGIHARLHACDWSRREADKRTIAAGLRRGARVVEPLDHRGLCDSEAENLMAARLWAESECPPKPPLWQGERYRHDRIRVAYLSTDFRAHAVAFLIAGIFEHHDRRRFETIAISLSPDDKSETRSRIETAFEHFIDVRGMNDAEAAARMRDREIDIAIDLNGYTGDARTGILAFRPAPVQVNYLGYPGTLGAPYLDYIIADAIVIPASEHGHYSEKVVWLPDTYQANDRGRRIGETPTRAQAGLPERGFVLACFNNSYKIGPEIFDIWMRLLGRVEGSVLWLLEDNAVAAAHLRREAEARGVGGERLVFAPRVKPHEHLARQRLADLFLDTLPYNAHTTASDALWLGLPLLTCPGHTFPARVAASLLRAIAMPELIAASPEAYESLALELARDPAKLASIRAKLATNRDGTALFDTARCTRHLESAYITMHERQQRGLPPESFAVAPVT
jgi:protein O-GlcNAc transferase